MPLCQTNKGESCRYIHVAFLWGSTQVAKCKIETPVVSRSYCNTVYTEIFAGRKFSPFACMLLVWKNSQRIFLRTQRFTTSGRETGVIKIGEIFFTRIFVYYGTIYSKQWWYRPKIQNRERSGCALKPQKCRYFLWALLLIIINITDRNSCWSVAMWCHHPY